MMKFGGDLTRLLAHEKAESSRQVKLLWDNGCFELFANISSTFTALRLAAALLIHLTYSASSLSNRLTKLFISYCITKAYKHILILLIVIRRRKGNDNHLHENFMTVLFLQ